MNNTRTTVTEFFDSYRVAFACADAAAIVDHFAFPCHVTTEAREIALTVLGTRADGERTVGQILDMYRKVGVSSARVVDLAASEISPRLAQVMVHWALENGAGVNLYAFEAGYTLVAIDGALRISAIAHNEIQRYREYFARVASGSTNSTPG